MFARNVGDVFLPFVVFRRGGGEIDIYDVLVVEFFLEGFHFLVPEFAWAAPCSPDVDDHGLALVAFEDGMQDAVGCYIRHVEIVGIIWQSLFVGSNGFSVFCRIFVI